MCLQNCLITPATASASGLASTMGMTTEEVVRRAFLNADVDQSGTLVARCHTETRGDRRGPPGTGSVGDGWWLVTVVGDPKRKKGGSGPKSVVY